MSLHSVDEELQVDTQLRDVESRLVDRYGDRHGADQVRHTIARISARFAEARVRTFVPILVERAARAALEP